MKIIRFEKKPGDDLEGFLGCGVMDKHSDLFIKIFSKFHTRSRLKELLTGIARTGFLHVIVPCDSNGHAELMR